MDIEYQITPIGYVKVADNFFSIEVMHKYRPGLANLEGFSHLMIIWWGHKVDQAEQDELVLGKLFQKGPEQMGVFSTRSPLRPNPILISTITIQTLDIDHGIITTPFIDAADNTPILDIKPYFPMDRVRGCHAPEWCQHWPQWFEDYSTYDWKKEMVTKC